MIDQLIRWSLHYRAVVVALSIAFLAWGVYVAREMPLDVLPDLTAPTVTILVEARAWSQPRWNPWSRFRSSPH